MTICACGQCGLEVKEGSKYIRGHNMYGNKYGKALKGRKRVDRPKCERCLCPCGCGLLANYGKKYRSGHNSRVNHGMSGRERPDVLKRCRGVPRPDQSLRMIAQNRLMKHPLSVIGKTDVMNNNEYHLKKETCCIEDKSSGVLVRDEESYDNKMYKEAISLLVDNAKQGFTSGAGFKFLQSKIEGLDNNNYYKILRRAYKEKLIVARREFNSTIFSFTGRCEIEEDKEEEITEKELEAFNVKIVKEKVYTKPFIFKNRNLWGRDCVFISPAFFNEMLELAREVLERGVEERYLKKMFLKKRLPASVVEQFLSLAIQKGIIEEKDNKFILKKSEIEWQTAMK